MTHQEHRIIGLIALIIIYQIIWHLYLKHHPVAQKNAKEIDEIVMNFFFK